MNDFIKDRNKMAKSGKYDDYVIFCKKYNLPYAKEKELFEITLHKIRVNLTTLPKKMIEESKKWLLDRGYSIDVYRGVKNE